MSGLGQLETFPALSRMSAAGGRADGGTTPGRRGLPGRRQLGTPGRVRRGRVREAGQTPGTEEGAGRSGSLQDKLPPDQATRGEILLTWIMISVDKSALAVHKIVDIYTM